MVTFTSAAAVDEGLEHYSLRPSKMTGRPLAATTVRRIRYFMTPKAKDVFTSGLTGHELMIAIDRAFETESKTHRSIGIIMIAQFANYYGLIDDEVYAWWSKEGDKRYKPNKPVAERIIQRDKLKRYFDRFLQDDPNHFTAARLYCFSSILLLTGARQHAIVELKMDEFTLTETEMTINIKRLKSANSALHTIHVPLDVLLPNGRPFGEALYRYLSLRFNNEYFFMDTENRHGSGLHMSLRHQMERHGKLADCGHITPHMFRFTCASIISDHIGVRQAQQLLGHTDMKTTLRYAGHFYDNVSKATISNGFSSFSNHYKAQ
jgi:integrase